MNTSTLEHSTTDIRQHGGQAIADDGAWIVGRGQRVTLVRRRSLRRRSVEAIVLDGRLDLAHDPARSTFEMTLMLADGVELVTVSTAGSRPVQLDVCGVFHHRGRVPSLWLSVSARLDGGVAVRGDLNLNPA